MNVCNFSKSRLYRYSLQHRWDELMPLSRIMWVGLNPSTADEQTLDPTLRRIKAFSKAWGYTEFVMTNLFAFVATDPKVMFAAEDPVGPGNDSVLGNWATQCDVVVACWGNGGNHRGRARAVSILLADRMPGRVFTLGTNADGSPKHPLYLPASAARQPLLIAA